MKKTIKFNCDVKKYLPFYGQLSAIILGCFLFCNTAKAQYVAIPDTAFALWLENNGFAGCMVGGNLLDTTCSGVLDSTTIVCPDNILIHNVTGIQYFKHLTDLELFNDSVKIIPAFPPSLQTLNLANNRITTLPPFPATLTSLTLDDNQISALPALPAGLTYLSCYVNLLSALPALPGSLNYLSCEGNAISSIPPLPAALQYLFCGFNPLTSLPTLPSSLHILTCRGDQLTALPALPASIDSMDCSSNSLTALPSLPVALSYLVCADNHLTGLPPLPSSLTYLVCSFNPLVSLPALPPNLTYLDCTADSIVSIPDLPDSMYILYCYNNPNLTCMGKMNRVYILEFTSTAIACLPNYGNVTSCFPALNTVPLCEIGNVNGCAVYDSCANQCVWPGDANYDGLVNNNDLLPIGLAYDSSGFIRNGATLSWIPQYCQNWNDSLQDSINFKHIDCDGNGIINADDTMAIIQNYSLTHPRNGGYDVPRAGAPLLFPNLSEDTAYNGDTLTVQLVLGDSAIPANNVYGLAFTLNYDATVVDTSKTTITFGNSWLGSSANKISIAKDLKTTGELECALTRIDHTTKSGQGPIGVATFVITTDNINGKNYSYYNARFYISAITMIDSAGNILPVNAWNDSTQVGYLPTGINHLSNVNSEIHIYPNPASNQLLISSGQLRMEQIRISDVQGREVMRNTYSPGSMVTQQQLDISNLTPGIYTVEVLTDKGVAVQKLVIAR